MTQHIVNRALLSNEYVEFVRYVEGECQMSITTKHKYHESIKYLFVRKDGVWYERREGQDFVVVEKYQEIATKYLLTTVIEQFHSQEERI